MHITTIGLDLAKSWFQVHGVDADGKVAGASCDAARSSASLSRCRDASLASRPVPPPIIGPEN